MCISIYLIFFFIFTGMDSRRPSEGPSPIPSRPFHHQHHSADEEEEEEEGYDDEEEQPRAPTTKRTMEEEEEEEIYSGVEGQYNLCSGCSDIYLPFQSCT